MKHFFFLFAIIAGAITANAQTAVDNFNVGPYVVYYNGQGDVRYRLRDNVDLYEFFELKKDTTIISVTEAEPLKHAIQISGHVGANRYASKEFGLDGVWKQNIGNNLYFNGGLSLSIDYSDFGEKAPKRNMFEVGIPLQIELGKLNRQYASFYGLFGVTPTVYTTMSATKWDAVASRRVDDIKKSGFLVAPSLEFGGNLPVGNTVMRIGVYGTYKINCTTSDFDVYKKVAGRMFLGAKIGIVL